MSKFIIKTQYKEWYGNTEDADKIGNPVYGRHKMKGGTDFVFEVGYDQDSEVMYNEDKIIADFNAVYDVPNRYCRYEALSIEVYEEPQKAMFVDGKVMIDQSHL